MNNNTSTLQTKVVRLKNTKCESNFKSKEAFYKLDTSKGREILQQCSIYWEALEPMRNKRRINRDFRNGKQWTQSEYAAIKENGGEAIIQNICALMVRNLLGQYWNNKTFPIAIARKSEAAEEGAMMSLAIERAININNDTEKDARMLEEVVLSGVACSRVGYSWNEQQNRNDIYTLNVHCNRLFFNPDIEDTSMLNLHTIGEICDDTFSGILCKFAKTEKDKEFLQQIYPHGQDRVLENGSKKRKLTNRATYDNANPINNNQIDNTDFYNSNNETACRYYEVWRKEVTQVIKYHDYATAQMGISEYSAEELELENEQRIALANQQGIPTEEVALIYYEQCFEQVWKCYYIAPNGFILSEKENPYLHEQHPYTLMLHTFLDGEIHPIMNDVIPQQRYMNRLIQMIDFAMGRAAKGVLIIPEDCVPEGYDLDEIAEKWSSFNGVIKLKLKAGVPIPQQITANITNFGAMEMFNIQLQLAQQIFGVNPAIQGQAPSAGTPASRYAQETQNATLNSKDLFEMFAKYKQSKYLKIMKLIQQYYQTPMYIKVAGKNYQKNDTLFVPEKVRDLEFDLAVSQASNSPAFKVMEDEQLFKFVEMGLLDLDSALSVSGASYAPILLELIKKKKEELQQQQIAAQSQSQPQPQNVNAGLQQALEN